jgi:hypothetical protein
MSYDLGKAVGYKSKDQPVRFSVAAVRVPVCTCSYVGFVDS